LIAPLFLKLAGMRVLVSRRDMGIWYTPSVLRILRFVSRFVDRYVANSRTVARYVQDQEGVSADRISVIYNGYEPYRESNVATCGGSLLPGVALGTPVIGIVANLRPVKRIDTLVDAFAAVSQTFPAARLVVVGDCSSPQAFSTARELGALVDRLRIRERVIFTGQVDEPMKYVERFTVAVLCSESEGFSNSIIEYMQAGRPVVCTDTGGNPEIVIDGCNGFLVPVGDVRTLAERLVRLLSNSALARQLGAAGRETVRAYSYSRMVAEQMACYTQVLAGG
jgi:glycosyltransferase involved in cell wall biosynthesis